MTGRIVSSNENADYVHIDVPGESRPTGHYVPKEVAWIARYGTLEQIYENRYMMAGIIEHYSCLLSDEYSQKDAIDMLKRCREAYKISRAGLAVEGVNQNDSL